MTKSKRIILYLVIALMITIPTCVVYGENQNQANDETFNVAYIEGDPYINYAGNLSGLVKGLAELGYVGSTEEMPYEKDSDDANAIWKWLDSNSKKDIAFDQNEFYSLVSMTEAEKTKAAKHLNQSEDIDLILVMGTAAGTFAKESGISKDMMIMSVTDARQAELTKGQKFSGIDNVWAHTSPRRYYNQLKVFYKLFTFKTLGIVYEDTDNGRKEISYDVIKDFTKKNGIGLMEVRVDADSQKDDKLIYERKMQDGYRSLKGRVDAVYMTNSGNRSPEKIDEYVNPLYEAGIPVFSQTGKSDVEMGVMLAISPYDFDELGAYTANTFAQILKGKTPGQLPQNYDEAQTISVNMTAAEEAGIKIPFKVLLSADNIYTETGGEE